MLQWSIRVALLAQACLAETTPASAAASDAQKLESQVLSGVIEGFLSKEHLAEDEMVCIQQMATDIDQEVKTTIQHLHDLVDKAFGSRRRLLPAGEEGGGTMQLIPDIKASLINMIKFTKEQADRCIKDDRMQVIQFAVSHIGNLTYVGGQLLANGADIAMELTFAIKAWDKQQFEEFGKNIGQAYHDILVGAAGHHYAQAPPPAALAQISEGLLRGFFGNNFALVLGKEQSDGTVVPLHISLHQCVAQNILFFRATFGAIAGFFEEVKRRIDGLPHDPDAAQKEQMALATAMLGFPSALDKCGTTENQKVTMTDAVHAMMNGQVKLDLPSSSTKPLDASIDLTAAAAAFDHQQWATFGMHLGKLLQRMALLAFPQKYSLDMNGALHSTQTAFARPQLSPVIIGVASSMVFFTLVALVIQGKRIQRTPARSTVQSQWAPVQIDDSPRGQLIEA